MLYMGVGQRPSASRGYLFVFQRYGGVAWSLCVRYLPPCPAISPPSPAVRNITRLTPPLRKWFLQSLTIQHFHKLLAGFEDKSAQAVCTFGYCEGPGEEVLIFQGRTDGSIVEARGPTDFGTFSSLVLEMFERCLRVG